MDYFEGIRRLAELRKMEAEGQVADSMGVRLALIERMHRGEITLAGVQKELARIKRTAKKNGQVTRSQAYRGHQPFRGDR